MLICLRLCFKQDSEAELELSVQIREKKILTYELRMEQQQNNEEKLLSQQTVYHTHIYYP